MRLTLPALLLAALVVSCSSPSPSTPTQRAGLGGERVWVETTGDELIVKAAVKGSANWPTLLRLEDLLLDDGQARHAISLQGWHVARGNRLEAEAQHGEHQFQVSLHIDDDDALQVTVIDSIRLGSPVLSLALRWRFEAGPVEEFDAPLATPDGLATDRDFRSPLLFVRSENKAVGLIPDLDLLDRDRRLPQMLQIDRDAETTILAHGLRADAAVQFRGEELTFAHRLQLRGDAEARLSRGAVHDEIWTAKAARHLRRSSYPLKEQSWHLFEQQALANPDPLATGGLLQLGERHNLLHTASLLAREGQRLDRPDLQARADAILQFVLAAPRRAGLPPGACRLDADGGEQLWLATAPDSDHPDAYRATHAAATGRLLIELADLLPERRTAIDELCAGLARFLLQNQAADGHIPALYEEQYLQPGDGENDCLAIESAGPAWFLALWAEHSGDAAAGEAARRAMKQLADALPELQLGAEPRDPQDGPVPLRDTASLARAISAAAALPAQDPTSLKLVTALTAELAGLQQAWQPLWRGDEQLGAFVDRNLSPHASACSSALAAAALFDAYRRTGHRTSLQRAVMALRRAMLLSEGPDNAALVAQIIDRQRRSLGQAVVDAHAGWGEGLDALWIEGLRLSGNLLDFRTLTHSSRLERVRVGIRRLPDEQQQLDISGIGGGPFDAARLAEGIDIPVRRVAAVEFRPPTELRDGSEWRAKARIVGPSLRSATQWLVIEQQRNDDKQRTIRIPVLRDVPPDENSGDIIDGEHDLLAERSFRTAGLDPGDRLEVWIEREEAGRRTRTPPDQPHEIVIGTMNVIDVGDQDEPGLIPQGSDSRIVRYVDGRENARLVDAGQSISYRLPVRSDALTLRLEIRHSGPVRLATEDGQLLHVDTEASEDSRSLELELSDPRRWRDGNLVLQIAPATENPVQIARLAWDATGQAATVAPELGRELAARAPDARIRALVIPIKLDDRPAPASNEDLREAFFAGPEYKRTPEPQPRLTLGSAASWIERLSGGLTALDGDVSDSLTITASIADLDNEEGIAALFAELPEQVDAGMTADLPTVICLIHGGSPLPLSGQAIEVDGHRVLLLAERDKDGSFLSCGSIVLGLMRALYEIEELGPQEQGNFDGLMLSSANGGHMPTPPSAANLERAGWVGHIHFGHDESGPIDVDLAHILDGRTYLTLDDDSLPDRGQLVLELRDGRPVDPLSSLPASMPGAGLSIYRAMPPSTHLLLRRSDGRSSEVRTWRIAAELSPLETPFVAGSGADLVADSSTLQQTWLMTPQGEAPWSLTNIHVAGRRAEMRCEWHGVDLLRAEPADWSAGESDLGFAPLVADGHDRGFGSATRNGDRFALELPTRNGRTIRLRAMAGPFEKPTRLFGRIKLTATSSGSGELRVKLGGNTAVLSSLDPKLREVERFVLDLPILNQATPIDLEFRTLDAGLQANIERLLVLPLSNRSSRVPLQGLDRASVRLTDQVAYANTAVIRLDQDGNARVRVPLLLPKGRAGLRIHCGLRAGETRAVVMRASVRRFIDGNRFTALDGLIVDADSSPRLALIELPRLSESRAALLELTLDGQPGVELHLLDVAVIRR